jgi:hypothetical protein
MLSKKYYFILAMFLASASLKATDVLVEFKGAYFYPQSSVFRHIYHNAALWGPEVTFKLCDQFYGFVSADFLIKRGDSIGLHTPTKVFLIPLGVGLKYFIPFHYGDFYVGLGFQPTRLHTNDCSPFVVREHTKWGYGGIAKFGTYINLSCNLILDLFVDYSFVKVPFHCTQGPTGPLIPRKADISGAIFGAGLGYRFH